MFGCQESLNTKHVVSLDYALQRISTQLAKRLDSLEHAVAHRSAPQLQIDLLKIQRFVAVGCSDRFGFWKTIFTKHIVFDSFCLSIVLFFVIANMFFPQNYKTSRMLSGCHRDECG